MTNRQGKWIFLLIITAGIYVLAPKVLLCAEPSITEQRQQVIQKAQTDLVVIRQKLDKKLQEQVAAGDKAGARNTQLRILAATNLDHMLAADSQAGGDIFKIHLIEGYNGIINIPDFSELSFREIMNYRMSHPDELYDTAHITGARADTRSEKKDMMALRALEDRAIYYASQATYEDMHAGFRRGMASVALALNDTFADINPATSLLEAGLGVKVSGTEIGQQMTGGERAWSLGKFVLEAAVDVGTEHITRDAVKGIGTRVGTPRGSADTPKRGDLQVETDAPDAPHAGSKASDLGSSGEHVIGRVNLEDVNNLDDITPLTGLDNFNIDLRTGQVTTTNTPGGRIGAADQAVIEAGFKPQGPLGGDQKIDLNQGTSATAIVKPPVQGGDKVIGYVDLENVNDVFDMAGLTHLENFNVDLRTGAVTTSPVQGGRIGAADQAKIEAGFKPQGPLGGDQKIDLGFQNATTVIDAQGMTTVREDAVWGGTHNSNFADPRAAPGTHKPADELKPIWDLFDLPPEKSKQLPSPELPFPLLIFVDNPQGGPRMAVWIDIFDGGVDFQPLNSPLLPEAGDPFGDCVGPQCVPSFGGPDQPFGTPPPGADFHSSPGGPGSQFISDDALLNDPVFFDQRFGELFQGAPPSLDSQNQPN